MKAFWALVRKDLHDTRWALRISAAALFGLGWLFVHVTSLNEAEVVQKLGDDPLGQSRRARMLQALGISGVPTSTELIMASWDHPFILIVISAWAIGQGAGAVAGEVERGTMDLVLSRPIARSTFLTARALVAVGGLAVLALALGAGAAIATRYNVLRQPPGAWTFLRPAVNLAFLGLPIYGQALLASSLDHVRRRPALIGTTLTLAGFIAWVIARIPVFHDAWWRPWLTRASIFEAYNPVAAVAGGAALRTSLLVLGGVGLGCTALAYLVFSTRDLPANG